MTWIILGAVALVVVGWWWFMSWLTDFDETDLEGLEDLWDENT